MLFSIILPVNIGIVNSYSFTKKKRDFCAISQIYMLRQVFMALNIVRIRHYFQIVNCLGLW